MKDSLEKKKHNVIVKSAKLFYYNGYINTGVNDILKECKIPKGSFYYYFKSKDEVLSHVIDYHTENILNFFDKVVDDLSIFKLKAFFSQYLHQISLNHYKGGSPLGNLNAELSDINEDIRIKLEEAYFKFETRIIMFLQTLGCVHKKYQTDLSSMYANILVNQLEGCCLKLKRSKNEDPINEFLLLFDIIFEKIINDNKKFTP